MKELTFPGNLDREAAMRFASLFLILFAGATNADIAETFRCQAGPFWSTDGEIVVVATINDDGETGTIKVAGIVHQTLYLVQGFDRKWLFGGSTSADLFTYTFALQPDGIAYYFDFTGAKPGETVNSKQTFRCK